MRCTETCNWDRRVKYSIIPTKSSDSLLFHSGGAVTEIGWMNDLNVRCVRAACSDLRTYHSSTGTCLSGLNHGLGFSLFFFPSFNFLTESLGVVAITSVCGGTQNRHVIFLLPEATPGKIIRVHRLLGCLVTSK